ncbi:MAG: linear amide C-N hydrolase [Bacteroidales bacterium]|nr:linear amide C-N hydrolase [Bacteroidales bacterium]
MTKMRFVKLMKPIAFCAMLSMLVLTACSDDEGPSPTPTTNDAVFIKDKAKRDMIYSLVDLEGDKGRIYEMNYTVDYKLDEALNAGIVGTTSLTRFVVTHLFDSIPSAKSVSLSYDAGCSAFACPDGTSGNFLMGRNFDFNHRDPDTKERVMIPLIAVHTAPVGGKKSVSFVDGQFVKYESGFYTKKGNDLSMLMALPYLLLDGINEDGFAVSVLKLDGLPTAQSDSPNKKIFTTVAMRMLLDRASTVKEAKEMLKDYSMYMDTDSASYHFFMADAKGDFAIVEYTNPDTQLNPNRLEELSGADTLRCVTNFYVSPTMYATPHGMRHSLHGKERYDSLRAGLLRHNYKMTPEEALGLLKVVAQGPDGYQGSTGFTQWSEVFNLSKKTVSMSIMREWDKTFHFKVE